jgi:alpha-mannosidase
LKISEDGGGYILRLYNTTPDEVKGRIKFGLNIASVHKAMLNENIIEKEKIKLKNNSVCVDVKAWEIVTLKIVI